MQASLSNNGVFSAYKLLSPSPANILPLTPLHLSVSHHFYCHHHSPSYHHFLSMPMYCFPSILSDPLQYTLHIVTKVIISKLKFDHFNYHPGLTPLNAALLFLRWKLNPIGVYMPEGEHFSWLLTALWSHGRSLSSYPLSFLWTVPTAWNPIPSSFPSPGSAWIILWFSSPDLRP